MHRLRCSGIFQLLIWITFSVICLSVCLSVHLSLFAFSDVYCLVVDQVKYLDWFRCIADNYMLEIAIVWSLLKTSDPKTFAEPLNISKILVTLWKEYPKYCQKDSPLAKSAKCNIYTSSVFCYDKHKKNFDIHFSMKRHEPVLRRIMTPVE